jgi:hypothetical protein
MATIGKYDAAGLKDHFRAQRDQLLTDARSGIDVEARVKELGSVISSETSFDHQVSVGGLTESGQSRYDDPSLPAPSRAAMGQARRELEADDRVARQFNQFRTTLGILKQGPGDGSKPGQRALYELAHRPEVVGLSTIGGHLEVTLRDMSAKAGIDAWYDQNCGDLRAGYRIMGLVTLPAVSMFDAEH